MKQAVVLALAMAFAGVSMPASAFQQWVRTSKDSRGVKFSAYYDGLFEKSSKRIATERSMDKCAKESKVPDSCTPLLPVTCVPPA